MDASCSNCRFFKVWKPEDQPCGHAGLGSCCRRAPYPKGFPLVRQDDWCGEHEPTIAGVTEVLIHNAGPTDLVFSSQASAEENRVNCETREGLG